MKVNKTKIIFLEEEVDVYDLTEPQNNNFLLSCGVFVHNSKDISDSLAGAIAGASNFGVNALTTLGKQATHRAASSRSTTSRR